jgi:hypothetical protein
MFGSFAIYFIWYLLCQPSLGWGDVGHRTVAYIAEHYLTEKGTELLNDLLPKKHDFDVSDAAIWADKIKHRERPKTAPWHFVGRSERPP